MRNASIPALLGLLASLTLAACDPGYDFDVELGVSEAVASAYDEQTRGLLVIDADEQPSAHWIVCGAEAEPIVVERPISQLGCPGSVEVRAFIAPLDASDTRACGELAEPDFGVDIAAIDPAWPQASAELRNPLRQLGRARHAHPLTFWRNPPTLTLSDR